MYETGFERCEPNPSDIGVTSEQRVHHRARLTRLERSGRDARGLVHDDEIPRRSSNTTRSIPGAAGGGPGGGAFGHIEHDLATFGNELALLRGALSELDAPLVEKAFYGCTTQPSYTGDDLV